MYLQNNLLSFGQTQPSWFNLTSCYLSQSPNSEEWWWWRLGTLFHDHEFKSRSLPDFFSLNSSFFVIRCCRVEIKSVQITASASVSGVFFQIATLGEATVLKLPSVGCCLSRRHDHLKTDKSHTSVAKWDDSLVWETLTKENPIKLKIQLEREFRQDLEWSSILDQSSNKISAAFPRFYLT